MPKRKRGRRTKLTAERTERIVKYVRAGAFPWVAAQAVGVGRTTFYRWMQEGEDPDAPKAKREFRDQVLQAKAEARIAAEIEARRIDPKFWLRNGPGKTKPGEEGWTEIQQVELSGKDGGPVAFATSEELRAALEARIAARRGDAATG